MKRGLERALFAAGALAFASTASAAEPDRSSRSERSQDRSAEKNGDKAERPEAQGPVAVEGAADLSEELNLSVGENKTISAAGVKSYSEGVRGVADVRLTPDASQFVVVGQKPGSTTLLLIRKDGAQLSYNINVFQRPMQSVERELMQLLNGTTGVRVRRVGARFFIEGGVSSEPELKRIEHIAGLFPGQVESLVVQGGVAAERKLNVRIDFLFVQFDRSKSYQFGVSWPGKLGGAGVASLSGAYDFLLKSTTSAQAQVVNQPLPGLDIAANNGWAKVLKHSTVITSNGAEATFSSGGEQNYVVSSGLTAALTQISFGTDVTVLPRFDPATRELEIKLDAAVTDLTPAVAAGTNLPGRNVSKLTTLVSLKLGQSLVLSGIRSSSERHLVTGLPLLSEIPLLGVLFGSHGDTRDDVEGVIFVVPSVVESVPKGAREIIDQALDDYQSYSGNLAATGVWKKNVEPPRTGVLPGSVTPPPAVGPPAPGVRGATR